MHVDNIDLLPVNTPAKMQQVESEVRSFYEYCRRVGFTEDELEEITHPLRGFTEKTRLQKWISITICIIVVSIIFYYASGNETLQWHTSAIARIAMMKILPFWDWSNLFYKRCLIDKNDLVYDEKQTLSTSDCNVCEAMASVERVYETTYDEILNRHLIKGAPIIITDANDQWIVTKSPDINITSILLDDDRFRDSFPCALQSNLLIGKRSNDLNVLLNKINRADTSWFLHFQNCELQAIKTLRTIVPRPYFLSPHIPPAHYNWLLMSNKYPAPRFKSLELNSGLIILSQLKGSTIVQLTPKDPCEDLCPNVKFEVHEGETLVLPNIMWNFDYIPNENFFNIAILTENEWNEL